MSIETRTNELRSRSAFRDIQMPIRIVKDRPVGTFSHDVESLRDNSFAIAVTENDAEIGLISKARNYSATVYDVMVSYLDDEKATIHELSEEDRKEFFSLVAKIARGISHLSGLPIAVGLNQHPNGQNLPYKNEVGQKNRVQTLQPLHVHIYETAISPDGSRRMGDLEIEDQRDICDPLILLSCDVLTEKFTESQLLSESNTEIITSAVEPPLGLNITFPIDFESFLSQNSHLLAEVQSRSLSAYKRLSALFVKQTDANARELISREKRMENVEDYLDNHSNKFSEYSQRMLRMLARELKDVSEVPTYNTFVNGPAVTYTIIDTGDGKTLLSIHPRLMSRGNSPDSYCIYVDNEKTKSAETDGDVEEKISFYKKLIAELQPEAKLALGQFMSRKNTK